MAKELKLNEVSEAELAVFKKKLKMLENFKGRHTELITQYIPPGTDRSTVMNQLSEEINQSSNIKSPQTRKNVQGALRKIIGFLKNINFKLPTNGIVVFAGNVSETDGRADIRLFTVTPVMPLKSKLYWCDSSFHIDYLKEMMTPNDFYAIMTIDKNEATIAQLIGKKYEVIGHFTSLVPGKTRAGGQCLTPNTQIIKSTGEISSIENLREGELIKGVDFKTGNTINTKVKKKWQTVKKTITIKTKNPQFLINCSPDHTFFVWDNGAIIEKQAIELTKKDTLLFNEKINVSEKKEITLTQQYNSYALKVPAQKIIFQRRQKEELSQKELGELIEMTQTEISLLELGKRNPKNETIKKVCEKLKINRKTFIKKYCEKIDQQILPHKLTKELAEFLGYFEGDGSFEKERISLYDSDKQIIEYYTNLAKKLFNCNCKITYRKNKGHYQSRIYGKQIVSFLNNNFPEINKALTSKVPKQIMLSEKKILSAFIKGLFDAEGYVSNKKVGFGINNYQLAQQIQIALLEYGIHPSLIEYDNRKNIYSKNKRYTIEIGNKHSIVQFLENIGFNSYKKNKKLLQLINTKSEKNNVRQILANGDYVKEIILETKNPLKGFHKTNMFLNNKRKISKEIFKQEIIDKSNTQAKVELNKIYEYNLLPTEIIKIESNNQQPMIDISTDCENFIANGLIVHNSAQRFERLREEATQNFFKLAGERFNGYFEPHKEKVKGVVIGGPGQTKNYFMEKKVIHHELEKKVLGVIDTSYTDEGGIRELVQKSSDLLKDSELVKEKEILDKFIGEIAKDGLATYGQAEVEKIIEEGRVAILIISEDIPWMVYRKTCEHCGADTFETVKDHNNFREIDLRCGNCQSKVEVTEEIDYIDWLMEKAKNTGADVRVISTETNEGKNFYEGFGGIGAILRYKI